MLRLTRVSDDGSRMILQVEGRIMGEWVDLLERECASALRERESVALDLAGVTYVTAQGARTLRRFPTNRLTILNCAPIIRECLREGGPE